MAILDTKIQKVDIECPHCKEEFEKEIAVSIYEPDIEVDVEVNN